MANAFYRIIPGSKASGGSGPPLASDVNQYAKALNGEIDIGSIVLAPVVAAPASAATAAVVAGSGLSVGAYTYALTYVTGHARDDGTLVVSGETVAGPTWSATTTTGNCVVNLTSLPAPSAGTVVAKRLYRTVAGGSQLKLVATLTTVVTSYSDNKADASLGADVPTTNTTGTGIATQTTHELSLQDIVFWMSV